MRRAVLCTLAQVGAPGWRSSAPLAWRGMDLACSDASWRPAASTYRLPSTRLLSSAAAGGEEQSADSAEPSSGGSEDAHSQATQGAASGDKKRVILTDNAAVVKALEHFIHGALATPPYTRLHLPLRARLSPLTAECDGCLPSQWGSTRRRWTSGRSGKRACCERSQVR